jgi:hypothetical protein
MKWRVGPCIGMLILLAVATMGAFSSPPLVVTQPNGSANQRSITPRPKDNHPTLVLTIGAWASENRDTVDPLTAIGALIVAVVLAGLTGRLWGATRDLAVSTEDLAQGAHDQFMEMGLARDLTKRGLDLQEKQFLLAARECDLAENQHGLQREQYLAEHRPRIKIRSIGIERPPAGALFQSGRVIKGSLVIVNIGASDAKIREADYRFFWARSGLPMVPPLHNDQVKHFFERMLPHTMSGHESCYIEIESNGPIGDEAREILLGGPTHLYVMGAVRYSDWNLKERWMGFCQKYTLPEIISGEGRFVAVDNPDYEYED